ncbi:Cysteine protease atg4 [Podila epicladia]|nr:Cysteine protease atg4 [Podila epicladia]KAG0100202.1 Cysteine protease atg4 [Podila epicladia]
MQAVDSARDQVAIEVPVTPAIVPVTAVAQTSEPEQKAAFSSVTRTSSTVNKTKAEAMATAGEANATTCNQQKSKEEHQDDLTAKDHSAGIIDSTSGTALVYPDAISPCLSPIPHSSQGPSSGAQQSQQVQGQPDAVPSPASRLGSRFSVNLSGVGLPAMATNLGLTQANSERAADMAQDLKKNVVNMWHAWFPMPSSSSSTSTPSASGDPQSTGVETSILSPTSGTQSLSQHPQQRPAKAQRMNSYTMGAKIGTDIKNLALSPVQATRAYSFDISNQSSSSPKSSDDVTQSEKSLAADLVESRSSASTPPASTNSTTPIYLLGKLYPPSPTQWTDFQRDFTNGLIWCTYRHSYAPIKPSNFTTDVGWGCMLRSGQGLLANALAIQFMGRDWSRPVPGDANWEVYVRVLSWFLDDMNAKSPFSVHRIALLGKQLGKNIGEWFGPSTTSQVTKALVHNFPESGLGVYVTTDGVVYKDQVEEAATLKKNDGFGHLLILVTIRLGIDKLNPIYNDAIKTTFEFPQSLGIAGGRPSSSYYFVGYQGDDLFYLDPHHSRCMVEAKESSEYVAEDFATYHCEVVRKIDINSIDPSMLLAFYCRDRSDFDSFCERVKEMNARPGMGSSIFTIGEKAPDYGDDSEGHILSVADEEDDDLELIL